MTEPITSLPDAVAELGALPMPVGPDPIAAGRRLDLLALMDDRAASVVSPVLAAVLAEAERLRARVAELERPAVEQHRRETRDSYRQLAAQARKDRDYEGEAVVLQQLAEREAVWAREDELAKEFAADPLALKPWVPGPSVTASADRLTQFFAPVAALREDPHDSPLHRTYRTPHDLPELGGA